MKRCPPSKTDFERLRRCNYADYIRGFDSTEEIANSFLHYLFLDVDYLKVGELIAELTYEEVVELMREFYHADRFTLAVVAPLNES
jgi:predicted Zn-dependent peptidase